MSGRFTLFESVPIPTTLTRNGRGAFLRCPRKLTSITAGNWLFGPDGYLYIGRGDSDAEQLE